MKNCSVCHKEFEDQYFDTEQNKCILHCDKNDSNGWYTLDNEQKNWDNKKINLFWRYIQYQLDEMYSSTLWDSDSIDWKFTLNSVVFPKFQEDYAYNSFEQNIYDMGTNFYSFDVFESPYEQPSETVNTIINKLRLNFIDCIFLDVADFEKYNFEKQLLFRGCKFSKEFIFGSSHKNIIIFDKCDFFQNNVSFKNSLFENSFFLRNCSHLNNVDFSNSIFQRKFRFQSCYAEGRVSFENTKFKDLADFYETEFNDAIFYKTDFEKVSVFSDVIFNGDIDFKYTKFIGKGIFRDTVIKGRLNLRDTIFDDDANFLDITSKKGIVKDIEVENRETARVIKNFYDKSNNIIEANKFYALEMKEREKELSKDISKNLLEWIIFKIHGVASDHSQSWILALFWMFTITMFAVELSDTTKHVSVYLNAFNAFVISFAILISVILTTQKKLSRIIFSIIPIYFLYAFATGDLTLSCFSKQLGLFAKLSSTASSFGTILYKVIMAYLVYQFVISVRQNTRRK